MTENETGGQLGEDPEVTKEIAEATKSLADFLSANQLKVDYYEADWRDTKGLIEGAHELILKHPDWQLHYVGGDAFGIDANYVLLTSKSVEEDIILKIGDYIVNLGAELPEVVVPPKPKCPECGEEIDTLKGYAPTSVPLLVYVDEKNTLHLEMVDGLRLKDLIDEYDSPSGWFCPSCGSLLFGDNPYEKGEMEKFLIGEGKQ